LLADDEDSDDQDFAYNSADEDDDDDDDESEDNEKNGDKQSGHVMDDLSPSDKDTENDNISSEMDNRLSDSTMLDPEPPKKRRKLDETENEDEQVENKLPETNNGNADDGKSIAFISPQSRRRKKISSQKDEHDDADVEKWAKAIITYHQQTEDLRTRYASVTVLSLLMLCKYVLRHSRNLSFSLQQRMFVLTLYLNSSLVSFSHAFLANVNSCSCSLYVVVVRPSVCLSSVCNVRAPYLAD